MAVEPNPDVLLQVVLDHVEEPGEVLALHHPEAVNDIESIRLELVDGTNQVQELLVCIAEGYHGLYEDKVAFFLDLPAQLQRLF